MNMIRRKKMNKKNIINLLECFVKGISIVVGILFLIIFIGTNTEKIVSKLSKYNKIIPDI